MGGIGIIMNPHSRANRRNPERLKRLGFIVGDRGSCHATHDMLDVEGLAKEFKKKKIDILGISGGDGTNHFTLSTFMRIYDQQPLPMIAFLRGGTMNNIANALEIKGSSEKILSNLIYKYHEGNEFETRPVDLMRINDKYGFLWGNGLISRFMEHYYSLPSRNPFAAGALLARYLGGALFNGNFISEKCRRFDARVVVDGKEWPYKNYISIFGGTIKTFGLNFRPMFRAGDKPGHFHILGLSMPPRTALFGFPWIFAAKKIPWEHYLEDLAREVTIELAEPHKHQIDGDIQPPIDRIKITMGPSLTAIVQ